MKMINSKWLMIHEKKKEQQQVFTLSTALSNAITMSAHYSGKRIRFTDHRK